MKKKEMNRGEWSFQEGGGKYSYIVMTALNSK
jgi:hypothetical protein